jgi:hypothetical protein
VRSVLNLFLLIFDSFRSKMIILEILFRHPGKKNRLTLLSFFYNVFNDLNVGRRIIFISDFVCVQDPGGGEPRPPLHLCLHHRQEEGQNSIPEAIVTDSLDSRRGRDRTVYQRP